MKQYKIDHSVFTEFNDTNTIILAIYMDDIIITGDDTRYIDELKIFIGTYFHTKDLGNFKYFFGIEVVRLKQGTHFCQKKYMVDLLSETKMLGAKPVDSPMNSSVKLSTNEGELLKDLGQYKRLVDKLMYLKITHPNIFFCYKCVSQYI